MYYSAWDTSTSCLKAPRKAAVKRCMNLLDRVGCGRLLMEIFDGALISAALATSAGWPCCMPIDVIHDGLDLTPTDALSTSGLRSRIPSASSFPFRVDTGSPSLSSTRSDSQSSANAWNMLAQSKRPCFNGSRAEPTIECDLAA